MIPRIYIPQTITAEDPVIFDKAQSRYLTRTLRLGPGAELILFNGQGEEGEWRAELIQSASPAQARLIAFNPVKMESRLQITLVTALAKGDSTEQIIQKAVELGAVSVIPLESERSVRRSKEKRKLNKLDRWRNIIIEAAEQCGRVRLPEIHPPVGWDELPELLPEAGPRYLFWEEEGVEAIKLTQLPHPGAAVTLLIGPEGGLSATEVARAREVMGFEVVGLGPRILRVATAGVTVITACQLLWGDMG